MEGYNILLRQIFRAIYIGSLVTRGISSTDYLNIVRATCFILHFLKK
jgi:hypothetical protein